MKEIVCLLSVLVLVSMLLAACGTPAPAATEAPAAPAATEPLRLPRPKPLLLTLPENLPAGLHSRHHCLAEERDQPRL